MRICSGSKLIGDASSRGIIISKIFNQLGNSVQISIITPSYNYGRFIDVMLDSVACQEGVTFEHIIYDAGSTDGTLDVIREYDHVDLTVEPDSGMSEAINKGFKRACGEWVMWLNSDDYLKPNALAEFLAYAERHEVADVIYGAWDFVDADGGYIRTMAAIPFQKLMLAQYGCYIGSTATFLRRETTIKQGFLLNERFKYVMDGEYYNRLAASGKKFRSYRRVVAGFRLHGSNLSQKYLGKFTVNGMLDKQLQFAESRTIRRVYGWNFFKCDHLNGIVDAILVYYFRVLKTVLKCFNSPRF